jgi:allantoate deiminase
VLESEGLPVGIVTAISAAQRSRLEFQGKAGHAGTVPMRMRHDAFAALADLAVAIRAIALRQDGVVATIGMVDLPRGAVNVIPSQLRCSLDLRASTDAHLAEAARAIADTIAATSGAHGVAITQRVTHQTPATSCAPNLQQAFAEAVARKGLVQHFLPSGAGHDGVALAARCPIGMLFVRCKGGISHHPDEFVSAEDAQTATEILVDTLTRLRVDNASPR